jgi:two-component sensor histidine kinase
MADARVRLETMSRVHRRLYSPDNIDLPIGEFLEEVCNDLIGASASQKIRLSVQMPPVSFSPQTVMTLTLIVVEIVTNSLKHAVHDVENPELTVVLAQTSPSTYSLSVKDNGPGLTGSGSSPGSKTSLGMRILDNFAKSLNGTMSTYNERGLRTVITFAPH